MTSASGRFRALLHPLRCFGVLSIAASDPAIAMQRNVRVYSGAGVSPRASAYLLDGLRSELPAAVQVLEIGTEELLAGGWEASTALLVFPGGRDLPYCAALNGERGTGRVARFVRDGGAYLGLCAGAYWASSRVEFELGTPLEVAGERELAFFPGAAVGAVAPGFDYGSEAGAAAMRIRFAAAPAQPRASPPALDDECVVYVNGGPAFISPPGGAAYPAVQTLATYENGAPAAVRCAVGAGVAVLCGPHPEMAPRWLSAGGETGAAAVRNSVLLASLSSADASRVRFWRALLTATGVPLATQRSLSSVGPFGSASELDGEPPPSPLRTIAPGPTAPAADAAAIPPLDLPLPPPAVAARRSSAGASGLGPLRACSHADLLALPHVPPLEQLVPPEEAAEGAAHPGGGAAVFVPWPRLASWLAATAALLAASRATRAAAPRISHAAGAAAGAAALAAGASVRLGGERGGVPITAQTLSACLCGLVLGPQQGVRAAALYAAAAAAGAPVLTPHAGRPISRGAHTASAGYVAGFALCAYAVGRAADACASRRASGPAFGASVAAAAAAAQLATAAVGGGWAACLLMAEGAAPDARGGRPRPWLLELALASAKSVPPFVPGLLLKACITGAAAAAAAPRLRGPEPPPKPALRNLLDG